MRRVFSALVVLAVPFVARAQSVTTSAGVFAGERVTLDEAVARAMQHNVSVQVANEEIRRSRALLEEARASAFPTITGNATETWIDSKREIPLTATTTRVTTAEKTFNGNVTLSVPLFVPGRWRNWAYASDAVLAVDATASEVRRTIALAAARAWIGVSTQDALVEAAARARENAAAHRDWTKTRSDGGLARRADLIRSETALAQAVAREESAKTGASRGREALGVILGAEGPVGVKGESMPAPPTLAEGLESAPNARGDLRAAFLRRKIARGIARDAWTDYLPNVIGTFAPFAQDPAYKPQPYNGWQAQVLLTFPIYDGGFRYGVEKENRSLAREADINYQGALRQALSEVRGGDDAVRHADTALAAAREAARLAHESLDLATVAFHAGATTNLDVIDAQRTALDADTAAATAEDDDRQARLEMLAASGRFP